VIDDEGNQLGVLSKEEAMEKAKERGLDLVEVNPNVRPPIVKIMDFGKFKYEQAKAERKHRSKQKAGELKEIRLGLKISQHDLGIKANQAISFLKNKNKLQIILRFKGREITHKELGINILKGFVEKLKDFGIFDGSIKQQGMVIIANILPK